MNKIAFLFSFYLAFLVSSCNSTNDTEKNENELPVVDKIYETVGPDLTEEQKMEIYKVENKAVIFFIISKAEAQNIKKEIGESYQWETDALFTGFINQSKTFIDILKKHNIKSALCNNKQFEIKLKDGKVRNFDRIKEDQILGEILTNGEKEPLICFGMYKDMELAELIEDFFGIKNLGYVSHDSAEVNIINDVPIDSIAHNKPLIKVK